MGLHHFSTLFSPSWSEFLRESKDGLDVYREASSAKSSFLTLFSVELTCRGKSFIYNRNKRGPRIDPWGTPVATICFFDFCPFTKTYWFLLDRYEENSSWEGDFGM